MRPPRSGYLSGFTLLELLTVIAIITVLAGIVLPVFARARGKAEQVSCLSNQKQLGAAALLYAQDWDSRLPSMWDNDEGNGQWGGWMWYRDFPNGQPGDFDPARGSLFGYVKSAAVYGCPADDCEQGNSYAINALLGNSLGTQGFHVGMKATRVTNPSATFLFLEEGVGQSQSTDDAYLIPPGNVPSDRHFEGSAASFCDGHAKWVLKSAVVYPNPAGAMRYEAR